MKKTNFIFCLIIFLSILSKIHAQNWNDYAAFRMGYSTPSGGITTNNGLNLQVEYGKTYKWMNLGIVLDYVPNLPADSHESGSMVMTSDNTISQSFSGSKTLENYTALSLHASVNVIRLFTPASKHLFKVGLKAGMGHYIEIIQEDDNQDAINALRYQSEIKNHLSFHCIYEFSVSEKLNIGAFYESGVFNCTGISISRNF